MVFLILMENIKKIYILTNTLKSGGAEKQSIYLAKALKNDYNIKLIVYYGNQFDQRMLALLKGIEEQVLWLRGSHFSKLAQLYRLFKHKNNIVIISYLLTTNVINAVIGKIAGVKIRIGGMRSSYYQQFKLFVQKFICNHLLTCLIFNNKNGLKELIKKGFDHEKSLFIHNAIKIKNEPINRQQKYPVVILSVGRFVVQKDYPTAFDSFAKLIQDKKLAGKIKYLVVGYGQLENELKSYVKNIGIEQYVEFIINPPILEPYYQKADIFLSTSILEGLCNTIMEAMECSLPVIATNVGDNDKLIIEGQTGFLTPIKDTQAIAEKLRILCEKHNLRLQMGLNGYHHLKDNFSLDMFKGKYVSLIERLNNEIKT